MLNTVGSAVKVFQMLDRKPQMREAGDLAPEKLKGRLTFEKVTFSYHSRPNEKALKVCFFSILQKLIREPIGFACTHSWIVAVCYTGIESREADGIGRTFWWWEDLFRLLAAEVLRTKGGWGVTGWWTSVPLPTPILAWKGKEWYTSINNHVTWGEIRKQLILLDGLVKLAVCKLIHYVSFGLGGNGIPGSCSFLWLCEI